MTRSAATLLPFFLLYISSARAQNCSLDSRVGAEAPDIKESHLIPQLERHKLDVFYTQGEVENVRRTVDKCNQQKAAELSKVLEMRRDKITKANTLLRYADVAKIREQIAVMEQSKAEAGKNLEKSLDGNAPYGLFVVLIKNVNDPQKPKLQAAAQAALAPEAVKDLIGTHVERVTKVSSMSEVEDLVKSYTNGEMMPDGGALIDRLAIANRYYLFMAKVNVKPLKRSPTAQNTGTMPSTLVLNLEIDGNYEAKLQSEGVIREHLDEIKALANIHLENVKNNNSRVLELLRAEIQKTESEIRKYNENIAQRKKDEAASSSEIRRICTELGSSFNPQSPEASAAEAQRKLKLEIANLERQRIEINDREIFPLHQILRGSTDDDLYKDIAQKVVEGTRNLEQQAGTSFEVDEYTEVRNGLVEQDLQSTKVKYIRKIRRIWAYPIAGNNNDYQVVLFGQFASEKGGIVPPPGIPLEQKPVENGNKINNNNGSRVERRPVVHEGPGFGERLGDFIESFEGYDLTFQMNDLFHSLDIGLRTGSENARFGFSLGGYWKKEERAGFLLKLAGELAVPIDDLWSVLGTVDLLSGIGDGSFLGFAPKIGARFYMFHLTIGPEYTTISGVQFSAQFGISFFPESDW